MDADKTIIINHCFLRCRPKRREREKQIGFFSSFADDVSKHKRRNPLFFSFFLLSARAEERANHQTALRSSIRRRPLRRGY